MTPSLKTLEERLTNQTVRVGVIGLGYVGLPQAVAFAEAGFRVLGFDIDPAKPAAIGRGESYLLDIPAERIAELGGRGALEAVEGTVASLVPRLRPGQLVVLVSTTYPGTTEERVRPALEATGLLVGREIALGYSPEREDPGNGRFGLRNTPKLVAGCTAVCRDLTELLYRPVVDKVIPVSSPRVAEASKLLENIYRAVNIALVNELKLCFDRMGMDVWEVIEAAATKPFGFTPFYPGPGLGGHCTPASSSWRGRSTP